MLLIISYFEDDFIVMILNVVLMHYFIKFDRRKKAMAVSVYFWQDVLKICPGFLLSPWHISIFNL